VEGSDQFTFIVVVGLHAGTIDTIRGYTEVIGYVPGYALGVLKIAVEFLCNFGIYIFSSEGKGLAYA
jgi:hypothetical protein